MSDLRKPAEMTTEELETALLKWLNFPFIDSLWCTLAVVELIERRKAAAW